MQEILFPILTGLSLVFAGILVGYYLWFRDRSDQLELCEQLTADNESLATRLSAKAATLAELEDQTERMSSKNEQLESLCSDLLASREKADSHSRDLESELYNARCKLDQAREQLTAECRLRAKSEESSHLAKQQYLDSVVSMEKEWKHKVADSQSVIARHENETQRLTGLYEQTAEKLHRSTAQVAELKSELSAQQQLLEIAKNNAVGLEKEYISLESSMRSQIELINESRGQAAAAQSAQKLAEEALRESRGHVNDLQLEVGELQKLTSVVSSLESQNLSLEQSLVNERDRVEVLTKERDAGLEHQCELGNTIAGLQKRSENQQQTIRGLNEKVQALDSDGIERTLTIEDLSSQLKKMEAGVGGYQRTIEALRNQNSALDIERNSYRHSVQTLRHEMEEFKSSRSELQNTIETLRTRIKEAESGEGDLRAECVTLTQRVADLEKLRLADESSLKQISEENARLILKLSEFENNNDAQEMAQEVTTRLNIVVSQRDNALDQIQVLNTEISDLREKLKAGEFPRLHTDDENPVARYTREYGGSARIDEIRGLVFTAPPQIRDDLKRIYGVAKVLEKKLNDYGIYTFKQIMEWDERAIQEFSELLIFKDRIKRDDWPLQAKRLHDEKYLRRAA